MNKTTYSEAMKDVGAIITLRISTKEPIELQDLVGAFTSLGEEYRRFARAQNPDKEGDARIFVKEIRPGSIVADLLPVMSIAAPFVAHIDQVNTAIDFLRNWEERVSALISGEFGEIFTRKSEFQNFLDATEAIAKDRDGSSSLQVATFEDESKQIRAAFGFNSKDARQIQSNVNAYLLEDRAPETQDHNRVLMVFTRTDVGSAKVNKRSGEKVLIQDIHPSPRSIMYASRLAEERIKYEIRDSEDNVYKKGFVVDVSVKVVNGKPSVYSVQNLHSVIELDEED